MDVSVWVDAWEFECCGEPFSLNSIVSFRAETHDKLRRIGRDRNIPPLRFETTLVATFHAGYEKLPIIAGTVAAIHLGYCRTTDLRSPNSDIFEILNLPVQASPRDPPRFQGWSELGMSVLLSGAQWTSQPA